MKPKRHRLKAIHSVTAITLCVLLHSVYGWTAHLDRLHGSRRIQRADILIDPLTVWFAIEFDPDGDQYFRAQLWIGGMQWAAFATAYAGFRLRRQRACMKAP